MTVDALTPTNGPIDGGTFVTVIGTNFINTTTCRFDATYATNATLVSASLLTCVSPALSAGTYVVELTNNDQDFTSSFMTFTYVGTSCVCIVS